MTIHGQASQMANHTDGATTHTNDTVRPYLRVRVRPFYHVPTRDGGSASAVAEYAYSATVMEQVCDDMWLVRFESTTIPGNVEQTFFAHELHRQECRCVPCAGR